MSTRITIFNFMRQCDHGVPLDGTKCNSCDRLYVWYGIRSMLALTIPVLIAVGMILIWGMR